MHMISLDPCPQLQTQSGKPLATWGEEPAVSGLSRLLLYSAFHGEVLTKLTGPFLARSPSAEAGHRRCHLFAQQKHLLQSGDRGARGKSALRPATLPGPPGPESWAAFAGRLADRAPRVTSPPCSNELPISRHPASGWRKASASRGNIAKLRIR